MTIKNIDYTKCIACSYPIDNKLDTFIIDLDYAVINKPEKSPCQVNCPAGLNIPGFIHLLKQKRYEEAIKLVRESLPLPAITSRVCFHPCESECARKEVDEAININALERFIADYWLEEKAEPIPKLHASKIAIVGSGPAGLAAAYELVKMGYPVTIFESMPSPGGMLRYGIPEYRLPRNILDTQIQYIQDMGAEFTTGVTIGKDITIDELKNKGYEVILIASGVNASRTLDIPGEELEGINGGLNFLKEVNSGKNTKIGKKVVVVGGGNVAVDAARTAIRVGAKEVQVVYRRSMKEMTAYEEGIELAESEGVRFTYLIAPIKILGKDGKIEGMEFIKMQLGELSANGRRQPVPVPSSEFVIQADTIIVAIGETPHLAFLAEKGKFDVAPEGTLKVDNMSLNTGVPGVFASGDVVNGSSSVVEAIASGRKAAISIDCYLKGAKAEKTAKIKKVKQTPKEGVEKRQRQEVPFLPIEQRNNNFREVKLGFTEEMALEEVKRCMICGVRGNCTEVCPMDVLRMDEFMHKPVVRYPEECMTCYNCELTCPMGAITVDPLKKQITLVIEHSGAER